MATTLCLGVVSAAWSGIGCGAFMIVREASGQAQAFDMRESAPLNMYAGNAALKASGALLVAVPGQLAGLHKAWKHHGKLPWKRLVIPAEYLAQRGFRISPYLYMQMNKTKSRIFANKGLGEIFTSNGNLLQPGDICRNKRLADALTSIARFGPGALYNGQVGFSLVRDVQNYGGILTMEDLQKYQMSSPGGFGSRKKGQLVMFVSYKSWFRN